MKEVTTVSLDEELVEWADEHHVRLGHRSRSALINEMLAKKRAEVEYGEEGTTV